MSHAMIYDATSFYDRDAYDAMVARMPASMRRLVDPSIPYLVPCSREFVGLLGVSLRDGEETGWWHSDGSAETYFGSIACSDLGG